MTGKTKWEVFRTTARGDVARWMFKHRKTIVAWTLYITGILDAIWAGPHMEGYLCEKCDKIEASCDMYEPYYCLWCAQEDGAVLPGELAKRN